jgi:hypothetical protein
MVSSLTNRWSGFNLLPSGQAFLDVRVIAFWVATIIPVTGLVLLGNRRRGLLDINRRWRRCGRVSIAAVPSPISAIATKTTVGVAPIIAA